MSALNLMSLKFPKMRWEMKQYPFWHLINHELCILLQALLCLIILSLVWTLQIWMNYVQERDSRPIILKFRMGMYHRVPLHLTSIISEPKEVEEKSYEAKYTESSNLQIWASTLHDQSHQSNVTCLQLWGQLLPRLPISRVYHCHTYS